MMENNNLSKRRKLMFVEKRIGNSRAERIQSETLLDIYSSLHEGANAPDKIKKLLSLSADLIVLLRKNCYGCIGSLAQSCSSLNSGSGKVEFSPVIGNAADVLWNIDDIATVNDAKLFVKNVAMACLPSDDPNVIINGLENSKAQSIINKFLDKNEGEIMNALSAESRSAEHGFPSSMNDALEACKKVLTGLSAEIAEIEGKKGDLNDEKCVSELNIVYEHLENALTRLKAIKENAVVSDMVTDDESDELMVQNSNQPLQSSDTEMATEEPLAADKSLSGSGLLDLSHSGFIKINNIKKNVEDLRTQVEQFRKNADLLDLSELSQNPIEGVKLVDRLQKKCREYSEYLMRDLLALDAIQGREEVRPIRKAQVAKIQTLMDSMDEISIKLRDILTQLQQEEQYVKYCQEREEADRLRFEKEDAERQAAAEARRKAEEARIQAEQEKKRKEEEAAMKEEAAMVEKIVFDSLNWENVPMKPKWHTEEVDQAYVITGSMPGLKSEDINIDLSGDKRTLILSATRKPTTSEFHNIFIALFGKGNPRTLLTPRNTLQRGVAQAIYKMCIGRFGHFHEEFALPVNVETDKITASYENNTLTVNIPKKPRQHNANPFSRLLYPFGFVNHDADDNADNDQSPFMGCAGRSPFDYFF